MKNHEILHLLKGIGMKIYNIGTLDPHKHAVPSAAWPVLNNNLIRMPRET